MEHESLPHKEENKSVSTPRPIKYVEALLFNIRWILIPFYLGLVVVLAYYGIAYFKEIYEFISSKSHVVIDDMKIFALDTIDIVMIANLIKMIITGSYNSFVSKNHGYLNDNISSGQLKVKIATSVVVLAMINLLKEFISSSATIDSITKQVIVFAAFLLAAIILSGIEYLHHKGEQHETKK